jgi:ribosomal protein S18 acetylase RimI-like enzyme
VIIRNIDSTELENFAQLIVSKVSFKDTLLSWIKDGITKLEWCFVIEDNNNFLGRIVYGVLNNELKILDINIRDHSEIVIYNLLQNSLNEIKLKGFTEVDCHLYSDKKYFEKYVESFIKTGFKITQEKKSFIWEKGNIINRVSKRLVFKKLQEINSNDYIDAIEKVTEATLDGDDLECITKFGSKQAAINYFNSLKDIDFNKSWWELAYTHNNELIGLVIPQKFNDDIGAINYIGVVPEKRGNGYVSDLIVEGLRILNENNIKKVIADIDVKNYPLEKALNKEEFKLDCRMLVLKL